MGGSGREEAPARWRATEKDKTRSSWWDDVSGVEKRGAQKMAAFLEISRVETAHKINV